VSKNKKGGGMNLINVISWNFGSSSQRFKILLKEAKKGYNSFHILNKSEVSGVFRAFGKMGYPYSEYPDVLSNDEYLFIGNNMCNYLILKLFYTVFKAPTAEFFLKRGNILQNQYPRLRYICVFDEKNDSPEKGIREFSANKGNIFFEEEKKENSPTKSLRKVSTDKGNILFLKNYSNPQQVVDLLSEIRVSPEDNPEIVVKKKT